MKDSKPKLLVYYRLKSMNYNSTHVPAPSIDSAIYALSQLAKPAKMSEEECYRFVRIWLQRTTDDGKNWSYCYPNRKRFI